MSDEPTLADLIEELVGLKIDLDKWEAETRPTSDRMIAEIRERIREVKEAIDAQAGRQPGEDVQEPT